MTQNPFELLLSLKQMGTVKEYAMEFEKYVGALREIDPEFVKGIFLKGLREEIRIKVRTNELCSLSEIIQRAIVNEQEREETEVVAEAHRATEAVQRHLEVAAIQRFNLESEAATKTEGSSQEPILEAEGERTKIGFLRYRKEGNQLPPPEPHDFELVLGSNGSAAVPEEAKRPPAKPTYNEILRALTSGELAVTGRAPTVKSGDDIEWHSLWSRRTAIQQECAGQSATKDFR